MGLFSRTTDDLKSAQAAKAEAEASVAALAAKRIAKLDQDGDPVAEVAALDRQIAEQQSKVSIYDSRIVALLDKQKRQARAAREEAKRKWLAEVNKLYDPVIAEAEKLDRALKVDPAALVAAERAVFALPGDGFWPTDKYALPMLASTRLELKPQMQDLLKRESSEFSFEAEARRLRDLLLKYLEEEPIAEAELEPVEAA